MMTVKKRLPVGFPSYISPSYRRLGLPSLRYVDSRFSDVDVEAFAERRFR